MKALWIRSFARVTLAAAFATVAGACHRHKSSEQRCAEAYDHNFSVTQFYLWREATRYPGSDPSEGLIEGDRASFIARCAQLPSDVTACLDVEYRTAHHVECERRRVFMGDVDPPLRIVHLGDRP